MQDKEALCIIYLFNFINKNSYWQSMHVNDIMFDYSFCIE